jgi:SNF2 family DNA or RNA helicase
MCAGLLLDPGLGKTSSILAAFKILQDKGYVDHLFVIAPRRVCHLVWPKEVVKWKDFENLRVEVLHGPKKEEALAREADIYIINPEGLAWLFGATFVKIPIYEKIDGVKVQKVNDLGDLVFRVELKHDAKRIKSLRLETAMLVVDESTKFKKATSDRSRILRPVLPKFRRRYILTGTICPNGLLDLFGQIYIMDLGRTLGSFITQYRNKFFDSTGFGGYTWLPKPTALEQIKKLLKPEVLCLEAKDYLELPEEVLHDVYIDLPSDARKVYDEMENELIAKLENGEVVTSLTAGVASGKCRQIANGGIFREDYLRAMAKYKSEEWVHLHWEKAEAVLDIVEECSGRPVLVAYDFQHDLARLRKIFGKDVPYLGSGVSDKRADQIERAWNLGQIPVLLGHPASVGHGLNLQEACQHVVWHSLTWDLELYLQFLRRVLRQGNTHTHVFNHRIIARGTIDEVIIESNIDKDRTQGSFLRALKTYAKAKKTKK